MWVQKIGLTSMPGGIARARTRFEFSHKSVRIIFKFHVDVFGLSPCEYVGRTHFQEGLKSVEEILRIFKFYHLLLEPLLNIVNLNNGP